MTSEGAEHPQKGVKLYYIKAFLMQKEGGIWLFHWSIFGVVPCALMFPCLAQSVADGLHQSCSFYSGWRRMLIEACRTDSPPDRHRDTLAVKIFISIKVTVRVGQALVDNLSLFDELADTRQFGVWCWCWFSPLHTHYIYHVKAWNPQTKTNDTNMNFYYANNSTSKKPSKVVLSLHRPLKTVHHFKTLPSSEQS